jgi:hypothetical protein
MGQIYPAAYKCNIIFFFRIHFSAPLVQTEPYVAPQYHPFGSPIIVLLMNPRLYGILFFLLKPEHRRHFVAPTTCHFAVPGENGHAEQRRQPPG